MVSFVCFLPPGLFVLAPFFAQSRHLFFHSIFLKKDFCRHLVLHQPSRHNLLHFFLPAYPFSSVCWCSFRGLSTPLGSRYVYVLLLLLLHGAIYQSAVRRTCYDLSTRRIFFFFMLWLCILEKRKLKCKEKLELFYFSRAYFAEGWQNNDDWDLMTTCV